MKGLILSSFSFLFLIGLSLILLRIYQGKKYFKMFLMAFVLTCVFYGGAYKILPDNLGFLTEPFLEPHGRVDFWVGALILLLVFHIFWDTAYGAVLTGFSSYLMTLLFQRKGLSIDEILEIYDSKQYSEQIFLWRINNLLRGGYLIQEGESFRLQPKGKIVARIVFFLNILYGSR